MWCRGVFAYRRKRLPRALRDQAIAQGAKDKSSARDAAEALPLEVGIDPERRLESLDAAELVTLFTAQKQL